MAAVDTTAKSLHPGPARLGRALISAGKLGQKSAEDIYRKAQTGKTNFIAELTGSGAVSAFDLGAHHVAALARPCSIWTPSIPSACPRACWTPRSARPTASCRAEQAQQPADRCHRRPLRPAGRRKIKFATQMGVDWIIAEYDKLSKWSRPMPRDGHRGHGQHHRRTTSNSTNPRWTAVGEENEATHVEVEDAPVVKFLHKMLLDAFSMRASDLHFEPYEHTYRVRFRIDGELREIASPPIAIKDKLASRIKVISRWTSRRSAFRKTAE
jgi:type IV pilus assembly protein PilB